MRTVAAAAAAAAGIALCGCRGGGAAPPVTGGSAGAVVEVRDDSFGPQVETVATGTIVEWRWAGSSPHDVTFDGFASPVQSSGTYRHTFARPGAYAYRCTLHEHMLGEVVVH